MYALQKQIHAISEKFANRLLVVCQRALHRLLQVLLEHLFRVGKPLFRLPEGVGTGRGGCISKTMTRR